VIERSIEYSDGTAIMLDLPCNSDGTATMLDLPCNSDGMATMFDLPPDSGMAAMFDLPRGQMISTDPSVRTEIARIDSRISVGSQSQKDNDR